MMDRTWLLTLADLFVNLSAGFLGASIIIPLGLETPKVKLTTFSLNVVFAIIFFIGAAVLRL